MSNGFLAPRPGGVASAPSIGTMTGIAAGAKSGGLLQVHVNGTLRTVLAGRDVTYAAGDVVIIHRFGSLWAATSRLYTAAVSEMPGILPDLDPNPSTVSGSLTVLPTFTGSYRDGAWNSRSLVRQGATGGYGNASGAIFYGDKPRSLSGATVTGATLETVFRLGGAYGPTGSTMWLVTESSRPAGAPTRTLSTAGPTTDVGDMISFTIPTAWAQAIVDGTSGGLGFFDADGSPYLHFAGRDDRPTAFTLVIDWSRTL